MKLKMMTTMTYKFKFKKFFFKEKSIGKTMF